MQQTHESDAMTLEDKLKKLENIKDQDIIFVRALLSDDFLAQVREELVKKLGMHVNRDLTMIEAVTIKAVYDIGVLTIKKEGKR
jgi:methionyl-tRNA synthetase